VNGRDRIAAAFAIARAGGRAALMPYYPLGYPDAGTSLAVVAAVAEAGADLIELGVPFSDPLADGVTIQRATHVALQQGMTPARCLELVARLRASGVQQPLLLMGYTNPILAFGLERFVAQAIASGVDGLIVPDLPPEEALPLEQACNLGGAALVYLLAPGTPPERASAIAARSSGFLYLVSVAGVTGARSALPEQLADFVSRTRRLSHLPLAVGFGIATAAQAGAVGRMADGVIVGSALIDCVANAPLPAQAAHGFVSGLRAALNGRLPDA
jgi:tryptophan synthase alpha chain